MTAIVCIDWTIQADDCQKVRGPDTLTKNVLEHDESLRESNLKKRNRRKMCVEKKAVHGVLQMPWKRFLVVTRIVDISVPTFRDDQKAHRTRPCAVISIVHSP